MKQEMNVLGIDIAKRVFHAVGMDESKEMLGIRPLQPALRPAYPDTIA